MKQEIQWNVQVAEGKEGRLTIEETRFKNSGSTSMFSNRSHCIKSICIYQNKQLWNLDRAIVQVTTEHEYNSRYQEFIFAHQHCTKMTLFP